MTALARAERIVDRFASVLTRPVGSTGVVCLCLFVIVVHYWTRADLDLFARVAMGRIVAVTGSVPTVDPFAFTAKKALWIDHEWLSGVVFYQLSQLGGDHLIFLFKLAMMVASVGVLAAAQRARTAERGIALVWLLVTILPASYVWRATVRSQVFTYLAIPLLLYAMVRYRRDRLLWPLAVLPLVMLFWANAHGGFVVGLGLLGIFAVTAIADGRRFALPLWGTLVACTLITLVNPYGLDYWGYMLEALSMERPRIAEWQPIDPVSPLGIILISLSSVFLWGAWRSNRRIPSEAWVMIAVTGIFAFRSGRVAAVFLMVLTVYGTDAFGAAVDSVVERSGRLYARAVRVVVGFAVIAIVWAIFDLARFASEFDDFRLDYSYFPVEALDWLQQNRAGGDLLVGFNHGSFALWRLYPRFKVSMDGRYETVYPDSTVEAVERALDPSSSVHEIALNEIDPDYVLLPTSKAALEASPFGAAWATIYTDDSFIVLEKSAAAARRPEPPVQPRPIWEPGF